MKPLWYARSRGGGRRIGGEGPARGAPELRRANPATLANLLVNKRLDLEEESFYDGVSSLPPGCFAWSSPDRREFQVERWYTLPESPPLPDARSAEESLNEFTTLLQDAVSLRLRSDIPVGLTLSGGLDSTAILDAAHRETQSLTAFTSVYGDGDHEGELPWARVALDGAPGVQVPSGRGDRRRLARHAATHRVAHGRSGLLTGGLPTLADHGARSRGRGVRRARRSGSGRAVRRVRSAPSRRPGRRCPPARLRRGGQRCTRCRADLCRGSPHGHPEAIGRRRRDGRRATDRASLRPPRQNGPSARSRLCATRHADSRRRARGGSSDAGHGPRLRQNDVACVSSLRRRHLHGPLGRVAIAVHGLPHRRVRERSRAEPEGPCRAIEGHPQSTC